MSPSRSHAVGAPVGILGGGQLARMLAESALRMGLKPVVYSEQAECPASELCRGLIVGRLDEATKLRDFVSSVSVVAFENEFVDCALLAASTPDPDRLFRPSLSAIGLLQDKLRQKRLLDELGIPTSPFTALDPALDPALALQDAVRKLGGGGIVIKWARQGYDGKGVRVHRAGDAAGPSADFIAQARKRELPVYAEKLVDFARELAIVGCRGEGGRTVTYPLVISEQREGICKEIVGPACHLGVTAALDPAAAEAAARIAAKTGLVGSFALEFFETRAGALLVNEIAPRVHNSGHATQNAFAVSQFENHWRALLGFPLFDPRDPGSPGAPFFAMLNLLGPDGVARDAASAPMPVPGPRSQLHWYGKKEIRPGRKLGHLNGTASTPDALSDLLVELRGRETGWIEGLRKPGGNP